jgi:fatty-acyl-CoA synthase
MPIVPMFHVNAWGLPYAGLLAGSSMVFPGPKMTPQGCLDLLARHRVTVTAGVPTIWLGALPLLKEYDLSALRRILCGGSAVPRSLSEAYRETLGLPILHAWGMTETSPVATVSSPRTQHDGLDDDAGADARARQGPPIPLVELRLAEPGTNEVVSWDDQTSGEIQAAGPWIASQYYRDDSGATQFTDDGWFRTGDVATMDRYGSLKIVDRTKDLVKSGGEWISSVQLENAIMSHPDIVEAAVIGIPHERWVERPLACVVLQEGAPPLTLEKLHAHLEPLVARWWLPDAVEIIDEVPKTSVGKFSKRMLRDKFAGYRLPA